MTDKTFMQRIYEGAAGAAETSVGREELKGLAKDQVIASVKVLTEALDTLPSTTNLHVVLFAITYVRNALIAAMQVNQNRIERETGGNV